MIDHKLNEYIAIMTVNTNQCYCARLYVSLPKYSDNNTALHLINCVTITATNQDYVYKYRKIVVFSKPSIEGIMSLESADTVECNEHGTVQHNL